MMHSISTYRWARPALRTAEEMALMAVRMALMSWVSSPVAPLAWRPVSITNRVRVHTSVSNADWSDMLGSGPSGGQQIEQRTDSKWETSFPAKRFSYPEPWRQARGSICECSQVEEGVCMCVCIWRWVRGCQVSAVETVTVYSFGEDKHCYWLSQKSCII